MNEIDILPWQQDAWTQLGAASATGRLPHGLLLRGPAGLGKGQFAKALAGRLLCQTAGDRACGTCKTCRLVASGNHPDYFKIGLDEDKKQIRVEQVRALIGRLALTSQMQGNKVAIVDPAEALNANAQNSLLKTLEEPPAQTTLILVCSRPSALAPTVTSRCQSVRFGCPDTAAALEWLGGQGDADWPELLRLAWGAPLRALALAEGGAARMGESLAEQLASLMAGRADALSVTEGWAGDRPTIRLQWLQQQVYGLIQWRIIGQPPELVHKTLQRSLQNRIADLSLTESYRYLDRLQNVIGMADRPINQTLTILPLLIAWADGPRFATQATNKT